MIKNGKEYKEVSIEVDFDSGDNYCNHCDLDGDDCGVECCADMLWMEPTTDIVFKEVKE